MYCVALRCAGLLSRPQTSLSLASQSDTSAAMPPSTNEPAMSYAPQYYESKSPPVIVKPCPAHANPTFAPHHHTETLHSHSRFEKTPSHTQASPNSYISSPEAPDSLSGSSTASYSQPESWEDCEREARPSARYACASEAERGEVAHHHAGISHAGVASQTRGGTVEQLPISPWSSHRSLQVAADYDERDEERSLKEDGHAVMILVCPLTKVGKHTPPINHTNNYAQINLSFVIPFYSLVSALCTATALLLLVLSAPFRIFAKSSSFNDQLVRLLAPLLTTHLKLIYSSQIPSQLPSHATTTPTDPYNTSTSPSTSSSSFYSSSKLVLVLLLSPFLSIGVSLTAWVLAFFWCFAKVLGDPDGTEKDDDGKTAVLGVRNWWERWLCKALRI